MLVAELRKLFEDLKKNEQSVLFLSEYDINVQIFIDSGKLLLTTPVYFGSNYIPGSVRNGIKKTPPFTKDRIMRTSLKVDEKHFRIFLQYLGAVEVFNSEKFVHLIEDFHYLAEEWRIYLDEHDKNDLVHIRSKK